MYTLIKSTAPQRFIGLLVALFILSLSFCKKNVDNTTKAFSYGSDTLTFVQGTAISISPILNGIAEGGKYSTYPSIPKGITLDENTGVISLAATLAVGKYDLVIANSNANKTINLRIVIKSSGTSVSAFPIDAESATLAITDFEGGNLTVVDNPYKTGINTSNKVLKMVKNAGAVYAGSYITLDNPIDFSTNKRVGLKVYSPRAGAKVLIKVENATNSTLIYEKQATITTANTWEQVYVDYSAINTANEYSKIILIFDNGTKGDGTANFTFYVDDITLSSGSTTPVTNVVALPIDAESVSLPITNFEGGNLTVVDNPYTTGINTSNKVLKMVKNAGAVYAGSYITLDNPIGFSTNKRVGLKVYSPRAGAKVLIKVENATNSDLNYGKEATITTANTWEQVYVDYSLINTANEYSKIILIFDNGTMGDGTENFTFYVDDITLSAVPAPTKTQINLPVDFESLTIDYSTIDFGGTATEDATDPTNASNHVKKTTKTIVAEIWAGTTLSGSSGLGFSSNIVSSAGVTTAPIITVRVYSPATGIPVRLKIEDRAENTHNVEAQVMTTVANTWETLIFDFSTPADPTAAYNSSYNYNKASIFFDFYNVSDGKIFYWDDIIKTN